MFKKYFVTENITLREAIYRLEENEEKCLVVVNKKHKLKGSLTDGDIRRAVLRGGKFESIIKRFYNKNPIKINEKSFNSKELPNIINKIEGEYKIIPVVDHHNRVINLLTSKSKFLSKTRSQNKFKNILVVIMSGGTGTRLRPYTEIIPKPLIPINGQTIIEHIISNFQKYGINNFFLSLNYKSDLIKAYFSKRKNFKLSYLHEKKPLGTAGALAKLHKKTNKSFFVVNCDTIIKCNYQSIYEFHEMRKFDLTIVASKKNHDIPYGVCKISTKGNLKQLQEKPQFSFLANVGFYIVSPKILKFIGKNKHIDMHNLIAKLIKRKLKIGVFPVDKNDWLDFGQSDNFIENKSLL